LYRITFYENRRGEIPVLEYIEKLALGDDKNSRIKFNNVMDCIDQLRENGTRAPEKFVKHIKGEIWELRPLRDRILFAAWVGDAFVLLHVFQKETQKIPQSEIEKAERELEDFKERFG